MNHMEFAALESRDLETSAWEHWITRVENRLGHSVDGDNSAAAKASGTADGYSQDECFDWFKEGLTSAQASQRIINNIQHLQSNRSNPS